MLKPGELKDAISKSKRCIWYAAFFSCFVNILMLTPPMYMLQLYDRVVTSRSLSTLFFLTLIVMILFVMMGIFEVLRSRILIVFATQLDKTLSERVYDAIFKLSSRHPGRVSSQAMSDLNAIKQYMSTNGIFAFLDAPWLPVYILLLFLVFSDVNNIIGNIILSVLNTLKSSSLYVCINPNIIIKYMNNGVIEEPIPLAT